jgi:putative endonuclease
MTYPVYILYSHKRDRFYVGQTTNAESRLIEHNNGESIYTSQGMPWSLLWTTTKQSFRSAEDLEVKIENLSHARKIKFMLKYEVGIHDRDLLESLHLLLTQKRENLRDLKDRELLEVKVFCFLSRQSELF